MNEIYPYPQVSIAIVNLNGKEFLNDCLLSIKEINYPKEKIEIIVVDNGSNDGSAQFIKSNYPEVKLIENRENLGFAKANNQAAGVAHGEYIAF